ncbi:class I SAM-dependent methyltransferase [Alicyclobacillus sp. TC]|uniref:class I SAM-dependent methyltransferase n=1 Tax=Alicyclobacillus sp. TC TaxID=2606450 RepID=UPI0019318724|nr:class I SAM-dependent methyltransferase [Alicyclobacillus sp. TC]QRF24480.1 class I SAM-dependent methyltransferase [Alicyclobacillus sp. TC]
MERLSEKKFWDAYWQQETRSDFQKHIFSDIFQHYLPKNASYFEIGCAPGTNLVYFANQFGYRVSGIDYSNIEQVGKLLKHHGIVPEELSGEDFFSYTPKRQYDVVTSFGFVEHFQNTQDVIERHMQLVAPQGWLVIEVPNIRYFNFLLYRILNPSLLAIHNPKAMNLQALQAPIKESNNFEIVFSGYYKSCFLYFNPDNAELVKHSLRRKLFLGLRSLTTTLGLENYPNRFFSPYLFVIAKRIR